MHGIDRIGRSVWRLCTTSLVILIWHVMITSAAFGFGSGNERVRLDDISVLTLHHGKMTAARRSSAVPQLKCLGGTAGCSAFTPQTVQCYNRGSDGYDVQWECKTDMDNAYRFGQIEVTCEGYASSEDEYVLRGSCGLEYTLDLTKEGMQQNKHGHQHSYYGNNDNYHGTSNKHSLYKSSSINWIVLAMVGVVIYILYRTCLADSHHSSSTHGSDDGYPGPRGSGFGPGGGGGGPPPPGFRSDNNPSGGCGGSQGCGSQSASGAGQGAGAGTGTGGGGAGFWTGAAAGGLLGYLFGGTRNRGYGGYNRPHYGYSRPRHSSGFSSGWGGGGGGFSGFSGGSTGTRTASGFGGTRRR